MIAYMTLSLMAKCVAIFSIIQSLEYIFLRKVYSPNGIWRWSEIKIPLERTNPKVMRALDFLLDGDMFYLLQYLRIFLSLMLIMNPTFSGSAVLLGMHLLTIWLFNGPFNGGSDYMALQVLIALTLALLFPQKIAIVLFALWYLAIQLVLSYFLAGVYKLFDSGWRSGQALTQILKQTIYKDHFLTQPLQNNIHLTRMLSWAVIVFEILFPLALLNLKTCYIFLVLALAFHILNGLVLGLNRFIFTWVAAYPALLYVVSR